MSYNRVVQDGVMSIYKMRSKGICLSVLLVYATLDIYGAQYQGNASHDLQESGNNISILQNNITPLKNDTKVIQELITRIKGFLNETKSAINELRNPSLNDYNPFTVWYKSVEPLIIAIQTVRYLVMNAILTLEAKYLQNTVDKGNVKLTAALRETVNKYLVNTARLNETYLRVFEEFKPDLICKSESSTDEQFSDCLESFYNNLTIYIDKSGINKLRDDAINTLRSFRSDMRDKIGIIDDELFKLSYSAGIDIYKKYNITTVQITDSALIGQNNNVFNVTPIIDTINLVKDDAQKLENLIAFSLEWGKNTLVVSGSAIYDIVGPAEVMCSSDLQGDVYKLLDEAKDRVAAVTKYVFTKALQLSPKVSEIFKLMNDINSTLFHQVSLLDNQYLRSQCPDDGKLYELYLCVTKRIDNFSTYYKAEVRKLSDYTVRSANILRDATKEFDAWKKNYVLPESASVITDLKNKSENFYNRCKAKPEYMFDYAVHVVYLYDHANRYKIMDTYVEINRLADLINYRHYLANNRSYTGFNISARLEASARSLRSAIINIPVRGNNQYVSMKLQYAIANSTKQFQDYVDNIRAQPSKYIIESLSLLQNRVDMHKSHDYSYYYGQCYYNRFNEFPLTDIASCNNNLRYRNIDVIANKNIIKRLSAMLNDLVNIESRDTELINNYADSILGNFTNWVDNELYDFYNNEAYPVPLSVGYPVLRKRCLTNLTVVVALGTTKEYFCIASK